MFLFLLIRGNLNPNRDGDDNDNRNMFITTLWGYVAIEVFWAVACEFVRLVVYLSEDWLSATTSTTAFSYFYCSIRKIQKIIQRGRIEAIPS